jgi:hypothetical protein
VRGHVFRLSVPFCGNAVANSISVAGTGDGGNGLRRRSPQVGALVGTMLSVEGDVPWGDEGWAAECSPLVDADAAGAGGSNSSIRGRGNISGNGWPHACNEGGSGLQQTWRTRVRWTSVSSDRAVGNVDAVQWVCPYHIHTGNSNN